MFEIFKTRISITIHICKATPVQHLFCLDISYNKRSKLNATAMTLVDGLNKRKMGLVPVAKVAVNPQHTSGILLKTKHSVAANLATLSMIDSPWKAECFMISRMIYRCAASFRAEKLLSRMRQLNKLLLRYNELKTMELVQSILGLLEESGIHEFRTKIHIPSKLVCTDFQRRIFRAATVLHRAIFFCFEVRLFVEDQLKLKRYVHLMASYHALISRIWILCRTLLISMVELYGAFATFVITCFQESTVAGQATKPSEDNLPRDLDHLYPCEGPTSETKNVCQVDDILDGYNLKVFSLHMDPETEKDTQNVSAILKTMHTKDVSRHGAADSKPNLDSPATNVTSEDADLGIRIERKEEHRVVPELVNPEPVRQPGKKTKVKKKKPKVDLTNQMIPGKEVTNKGKKTPKKVKRKITEYDHGNEATVEREKRAKKTVSAKVGSDSCYGDSHVTAKSVITESVKPGIYLDGSATIKKKKKLKPRGKLDTAGISLGDANEKKRTPEKNINKMPKQIKKKLKKKRRSSISTERSFEMCSSSVQNGKEQGRSSSLLNVEKPSAAGVATPKKKRKVKIKYLLSDDYTVEKPQLSDKKIKVAKKKKLKKKEKVRLTDSEVAGATKMKAGSPKRKIKKRKLEMKSQDNVEKVMKKSKNKKKKMKTRVIS